MISRTYIFCIYLTRTYRVVLTSWQKYLHAAGGCLVYLTCTVWTKRHSSLDITCYFDTSAAESGSINQMLARMPLICLAIDGIHIAEIPKILIDCVSIPIPKDVYISY